MNIVERLVYLLLSETGSNGVPGVDAVDPADVDADILVDAVQDLLAHRQRRLRKDGKPIESDDENDAEIARHVHATLNHKVALWRLLGLLESVAPDAHSGTPPLSCVRNNV